MGTFADTANVFLSFATKENKLLFLVSVFPLQQTMEVAIFR
jgi:hypothetical protein